jgi:hypothetical protein
MSFCGLFPSGEYFSTILSAMKSCKRSLLTLLMFDDDDGGEFSTAISLAKREAQSATFSLFLILKTCAV